MENKELKERLQRFLDCLELVFDNDWNHTKDSILDESFTAQNGTFLDPFPGEFYTGDNWANRESFFNAYRELKAFAISEGLYNPDEAL